MSGTSLTRSFRKSNLDSDIIHCFRWDGDSVSVKDFCNQTNDNSWAMVELTCISGTCDATGFSEKALDEQLQSSWDYNGNSLSDLAHFLVSLHDTLDSSLSNKINNSHFWGFTTFFFCCLLFTFDNFSVPQLSGRATTTLASGYLQPESGHYIFAFWKAL